MPGFKKLRFLNTYLFYRWRGSEYWTKDNESSKAEAAGSKAVVDKHAGAGSIPVGRSFAPSATLTMVKGVPGPLPRDVKIEELTTHAHMVLLCVRRPG